jgi:hypothetical protein
MVVEGRVFDVEDVVEWLCVACCLYRTTRVSSHHRFLILQGYTVLWKQRGRADACTESLKAEEKDYLEFMCVCVKIDFLNFEIFAYQ